MRSARFVDGDLLVSPSDGRLTFVIGNLIAAVLANGVGLSVPILWVALGETINERAGILNIAAEGVMLMGAIGAAIGLSYTQSLAVATILAVGFGAVTGAVLAYLYINRGADQIVTGLLFYLFSLGFTSILYAAFLRQILPVPTFSPVAIPGLSGIPLIGQALFDQPPLAYAGFLAAILLGYVLERTGFGLSIRSLGERPAAADAAGLSVYKLRWLAMLLGTGIVGLGGGALIMDISGTFTPNITGGEGFIALAVVSLCRWRPLLIVAGALMFGIATSLQSQLQLVGSLHVPSTVWLGLPYVITIVAIGASRRSGFPRAMGIPYTRVGSEQ